MKKKNGFLDGRGGRGEPSGAVAGSPLKRAKADGVRDVASAGGGRPVTFARRVRAQRSMVKMPRIEPRVSRRVENCSATDIIAVKGKDCVSYGFDRHVDVGAFRRLKPEGKE